MAIKQLARKIIPKVTGNRKLDMESLRNMPEMILGKAIRDGASDIVHVDMNHCGAALIRQNGVNTIYTDALGGCNSVGMVTKTLEGNPLAILSHYVPTNVQGQLSALEKQLETYASYCDKKYKPKLFFNIRALNIEGELKLLPNPIVEKAKTLFAKFFPQGVETTVMPYPTNGRSSYFSTMNAFQFDPENLNKLRITYVGDVERNLDLMM